MYDTLFMQLTSSSGYVATLVEAKGWFLSRRVRVVEGRDEHPGYISLYSTSGGRVLTSCPELANMCVRLMRGCYQ